MFTQMLRFVLVLVMGMLSMACSSSDRADIRPVNEFMSADTNQQETLPAEIIEAQAVPATPTQIPVPEGVLPGGEAAYRAAANDLMVRLNVSSEAIGLVSMETVEWSDASLGCPEEGVMYAQVVTPGYLIVLEAQGTAYAYHTNLGDTVVLCED